MRVSLVAIVLLLLSGVAVAQQKLDYKGDPNWEKVCAAAKAKPLPALQAAGPLQGKALETCDSTALYYGFNSGFSGSVAGKPDYAAALQCGWWQRAHPQDTVGDMFYGPGVLSMLYANGRGVTRNPSLALRFACEDGWAAPAEMEGRIGHLEALRDAKAAPKEPFDLCDDITSGLSMGFCTSIDTRGKDAKRDVQVNALVAALPAGAKAAFPALQAAEKAFEESRSSEEVDLSGTARGMFALEEEAKLRDQFLMNLQRFHRRDVPEASAVDLAAQDARLNAAYKALQDVPAETWKDNGTVNFAGIRKTERAWVKLVDAWVRFARVAYPSLTEARLRTQLIRLRAHQLESLKPQ